MGLLKYAFLFYYISSGVSVLINSTPKDVPPSVLKTKTERLPLDPSSLRTADGNLPTKTEKLYQFIIRAYDSLKSERKTLYDLVSASQRESNAEIELLQAVIPLLDTMNVDEDNTNSEQNGVSPLDSNLGEDSANKEELERLQKRSTFDSISHNGGLGRLGHAETGRRGKLAFTFKNLLPYLLDEHRRNNRASLRRRFKKHSNA